MTHQLSLEASEDTPVPQPSAWRPHPKPQRRAPSRTGPTGDVALTQFWAYAWQLAGTKDTAPILKALGVDSMKAWLAHGRTLTSALLALEALKSGETLDEALADLPVQD